MAALLLSGCAGMTNREKTTATGAGLGALTGWIIGHQSGNDAEGALIGAAAGSAVGYGAGTAQQNQNVRENQIAQQYYDAGQQGVPVDPPNPNPYGYPSSR